MIWIVIGIIFYAWIIGMMWSAAHERELAEK